MNAPNVRSVVVAALFALSCTGASTPLVAAAAAAGATPKASAVPAARPAAVPATTPAGRADPLTLRVRHGFADSVYGQVHYLTSRPDASLPPQGWKTPLVMFHQSPLSSQEFAPLIAEMGRDRVVLAFDTPGQGLSDGPDRVVKIADYAAVMDAALTQLGYGAARPVDVFANHTGVWIAGELAIRNPAMVRRLVLNGVYVVPEETWRANVARLRLENSSAEFLETMSTFLPRARQYYLDRGMSDADWGRMVISSLTPLQRREYGHVAAFSYAADAPTRLPLITRPTTLLLIDDGIADRTRAALPLFRHVDRVIERLGWKEGLFYTRTAEVGAVLREALDQCPGCATVVPPVALSSLERLLIQDEIRQKLVLYGLYADGDGPGGQPRDLRKLADTLMTADVVSEIHLVKGGPPLILKGREIVAQTPPEVAPERARTIGGRHYLVETVFDEVTPDLVRTRTPAVYFDATKNPLGPDCRKAGPDACEQKPVKTVMWVYHMTWTRTPQGWQISRNVLRDDN